VGLRHVWVIAEAVMPRWQSILDTVLIAGILVVDLLLLVRS
jgi:hypothetical protein